MKPHGSLPGLITQEGYNQNKGASNPDLVAKMQDTDFRAEAATLNFDVAPIGGEALQSIVERVVNTPKDVASRARRFLE
jgi:hypothetical protein